MTFVAAQPVYVDLDYVKLVGSMPPADVDAVNALYPGKFVAIATALSAMAEARLHKRYATPFQEPFPEALRWHVAQLVVAELWRMRGYNPGHELDRTIEERRKEALDWLKEAADSKEGLVELPKRADQAGTSAIDRGGPLCESEPSPYDWIDAQAEAIRGR